jgi:hypothetical protein
LQCTGVLMMRTAVKVTCTHMSPGVVCVYVVAPQTKHLEAEYARKLEAVRAASRATLASELHRLSMEKERAVAGVRTELTRQQREQEER